MKVPLVPSKFYGNYDLTTQDVSVLVEKIGAQLGAVEEVEDFGAKYRGVLVAKVVECRKHDNSDHLNVCKIDDGGKAESVERDENGYVQVVCGAPNVREGLTVAWLPPGATVPESYGKDPFVLETRELRGAMSNGMLASPREAALGDDHDGILEITEDIQPGMPLVDALDLNDHVIDIENKMFTHRPDCFGLLGVYREIAGIMGQKFKGPEWYGGNKYNLTIEADILPLKIANELPELVPRFMAVAISGITIAPSPLWLQVHLLRVGIRPINNIVDIANFVMYLTGQPLHTYDYDKVKALSDGNAAELIARYPKPGEKITLLSGKEIEPRSEAIMIASGDHLVGIGGVMGGANTEVDSGTKNIILECATFDMYSIRRTSMAHGLFTDAVTRYNKGQSPLQNPFVLAKAVHEICKLAGGKVASEVQDISQVVGREWVHPPVPVTAQFINERLGLSVSAAEMKTLLENVECRVDVDGERLTVIAPFWRTDIETREDVVEEVGRLYGFDKLPLELPIRTIAPVQKDASFELKSAIRARLAKAGANEVLTYSFVHGDLLKKAGQDLDEAFQVANALSPDLQYYRLSILPSLLDKVHANVKAGYDEFAMFEMGKTHGKSQLTEEGLPKEFERLAFVYAANDKKVTTPGAAYYTARTYLVELLESFGVWEQCTLIPLSEADLGSRPFFHQVVKPFDPDRSAVISDGQRILGIVGEFTTSTRKALKLPLHSAGFEFGLNLILQNETHTVGYQVLPRFPKVTQDITLKVAADLAYQDLFNFVLDEVNSVRPDHTHVVLEPLAIYQREGETTDKQLTFRLAIASHERTLTDAEVNKILKDVGAEAAKRYGAITI